MDDSTVTDEPVRESFIDFDAIQTSPSATIFDEPKEPDDKFVKEEYDEPDPKLFKEPKRSRKAVAYEAKVSGVLRSGFQATISNPHTVADAAAIAMHAPDISRAFGNLADEDERIARAIDWITDGTENPYTTAILTTAPLIMQMIRNHEPALEVKPRGFRIPFGKRKGEKLFSFKFGIKLSGLPRNMTNDPKKLTDHVFTNPKVIKALEENGWIVASVNDADAG